GEGRRDIRAANGARAIRGRRLAPADLAVVAHDRDNAVLVTAAPHGLKDLADLIVDLFERLQTIVVVVVKRMINVGEIDPDQLLFAAAVRGEDLFRLLNAV